MATPPKYIIIQIYKNTLCSEEEQPQRNKLGVRNEVICKPPLAQGRNGTPPRANAACHLLCDHVAPGDSSPRVPVWSGTPS